MLNGIRHRIARSRCAAVIACAASLSLFAASSPASASPGRDNDHRGRIHVSGGWVNGGKSHDHHRDYNRGHDHRRVIIPSHTVHSHGLNSGCDSCGIQREYARGYSRGQAAGSNQGFRDGVTGKTFCADVRDDLHHDSRASRDGYLAAFGKSYRYGFEKGRYEHARAHRPTYRSHYPRCP